MDARRSKSDIKAMAWKPRLKDAKAKDRTSVAEGSMRAADVALANMGAIEKRRARGVEVDEAYVSTLASRCRPAQMDTLDRKSSRGKGTSRHSWRTTIGAAAVVCGLIFALYLNGSFGTSSVHSVAAGRSESTACEPASTR